MTERSDAALSCEELTRLRERFENGQRALDPSIALRLVAQAEQLLAAENTVAYRFLAPIKRAEGFCTANCEYDVNGVCRKCECLDPSRFVVIEYPTEREDSERMEVERLLAAGIDVRRV